MAISGKYDFKGIKKHGASSLKLALASNPSTIWMTKVPFIGTLFEFGVNWLANNGLIFMNVGAIVINGKLDQNALDKAIDEGLKKIGTLTPEQMKEIDDKVIEAANRALPYSRK